MMFLLCSKLFFYSLTSFQIVILSIQYNMINLVEVVTSLAGILIDFVTVFALSARSRYFFTTVKETKLLSLNIMSKHLQGSLRGKAKKMYKLIDETPPRFSVYDMWDINARLVLVIFNVTINFLVSLFQLNYL
ncbi:hypothetical protein evm_006386 [Chilo suppressalis]|nr:hypothetical protein evm_006386 [Chilo suppressalis]